MNLLDSKGNKLVPGALYCISNTVKRGDELCCDYGALVWFAGDGRLYYDAEDSDCEGGLEECREVFDNLHRQAGCFDAGYAAMTELAA